MNKIAIDLDGVVFRFFQPFCDYVNKKYGLNVGFHSINGWQQLEDAGVITKEQRKECFSEFVNNHEFYNLPIIPNFDTFIYWLLRKDPNLENVKFVSCRPKEVYDETMYRLESIIGFRPELVFLDRHDDKSDYIIKNNFFLIIDDRIDTLKQIKEKDNEVICVLFNDDNQLKYSIEDIKKMDFYFSNWLDLVPELSQIL